VNDPEGMGGKISEEDKETILAAVKEKTEWLEEHPNVEAEDYEDQLSEFQSIVSVSDCRVSPDTAADELDSLSRRSCTVELAVALGMTRFRSAMTSSRDHIPHPEHSVSFMVDVAGGCL